MTVLSMVDAIGLASASGERSGLRECLPRLRFESDF